MVYPSAGLQLGLGGLLLLHLLGDDAALDLARGCLGHRLGEVNLGLLLVDVSR